MYDFTCVYLLLSFKYKISFIKILAGCSIPIKTALCKFSNKSNKK